MSRTQVTANPIIATCTPTQQPQPWANPAVSRHQGISLDQLSFVTYFIAPSAVFGFISEPSRGKFSMQDFKFGHDTLQITDNEGVLSLNGVIALYWWFLAKLTTKSHFLPTNTRTPMLSTKNPVVVNK